MMTLDDLRGSFRRSPAIGVALAGAAVVGLIVTFAVESGSHTQEVTSALSSAGAAFVAAGAIRAAGRDRGWPSAQGLAAAMAAVGVAGLVFGLAGLIGGSGSLYEPHLHNALFLILLVPLVAAIGEEFRAHFEARDRREIGIDVCLISASFAAILYVVIRPTHGDLAASVAAGVFAILAASQLTSFAALTSWVPTTAHMLLFFSFAGYAVATLQFGWIWSRGLYEGGQTWVNAAFVVCPLFVGAIVAYVPHDTPGPNPTRLRLARPVLTSASVLAACAALALVAVVDDERGLSDLQSTLIIVLLGLGVAARILANQIASTQAHAEVREALERRETALHDTDAALDRVRHANETLRQSEEHLRLVFDAAVDGFVELDHRGIVLRANDSFSQMIGMDRRAVEGQSWVVLAATVDGAEASFAALADGGQTVILRTDGQPLHLEARVSRVPTTPPRRLLLVRDVTATTVADQTIRSLFQFLQDRDEDRTRLLRRTNAAIESERNRIARDLHDGPVQGVSAASLSLEAALLMIKAGDVARGTAVLQKIRQELAGEADALRQLMSGLRPPVLEERGLIPALRDTLARFGSEQEVETRFTGTLGGIVPDDLETLAYRVVQEALTNCSKHAEAGSVLVHVESDQYQLRVEIDDDGKGFDSGRSREFLRLGRVGLASMRERVELASGSFTVRSSPGRGTTITAVLPLDVSLVAAVAH